MADEKPAISGWTRGAVLAVAAAALVATGALTALLVNIMERKQEAKSPYFQVVELTDETQDPAVWGKNFPLQYDAYLRTVDQVRTKYGGSEAMPHTPSEADPRSVVAQSRLDEDPRLKTMWAGYAFSVDFRKKRGHAYMLEDQTFTERVQQFKQPGTCLHCHGSVYVPYKKAGGGDLIKGFEHYNKLPYQEARKDFTQPVACIDCHDPADDGAARHAAGVPRGHPRAQGVAGRARLRRQRAGDAPGDAQLRLRPVPRRVLLQGRREAAHVPVGQGPHGRRRSPTTTTRSGFKDWVHAKTGTHQLKAQHPEFEMWNQGIHARSGVACADCHMPYVRVGAQKVSDHHVRSPLLNINNACQTCHQWPEQELLARAETVQRRTVALRDKAMDALMALIADIEAAKGAGATDAQLADARAAQRRGQFYLDFVESENSNGFHAPQEATRILGEAIDLFRKGQVSLRPLPAAKASRATD